MAKQLDADLKKLLTKQDAQEALTEMQMSAAEFERQAGNLSVRYSSVCKELTERTQKAVTLISENGNREISTGGTASAGRSCGKRKPPSVMPRTIMKIRI